MIRQLEQLFQNYFFCHFIEILCPRKMGITGQSILTIWAVKVCGRYCMWKILQHLNKQQHYYGFYLCFTIPPIIASYCLRYLQLPPPRDILPSSAHFKATK